MTPSEEWLKERIDELSTSTKFHEQYLLRHVAALRFNKPRSEVTKSELSAQYTYIGNQMSPGTLQQIRELKLARKAIGDCALSLAGQLSRVEEQYREHRQTSREKVQELVGALEDAGKDRADLQAMVEETKAAAAMEVQRLMEENARSNSQIEALGAQNEELEKDAVKNAGIIESQTREIARLEEQVAGLRVAAAGGIEEDAESGTMTFPFVLEEDGVFRYATKEEMAGDIDEKLVKAQKKPVQEYFEELWKESGSEAGADGEEYDASDEDEGSGAGESVLSMDEESVEAGDDCAAEKTS